MAVSPPDGSRCWSGVWQSPTPSGELWLMAAVSRTVAVLPTLHAWRLGDGRGSRRVLRWCGVPAPSADEPAAASGTPPTYVVLTEEAVDPDLPVDAGDDENQATDVLQLAWGLGRDSLRGGLDVADRSPKRTQWGGSLVELAGAWLPPVAFVPSSLHEFVDPTSAWPTESVEFGRRFSVYAADSRLAADVLAPHVMALLLDAFPPSCAVTLAGDACHVWWRHDEDSPEGPLRAADVATATAALVDAIPSFVLRDHPNLAGLVEDDLADKAAAAREYREHRRLGHSRDPVMQRIYDQARAALLAPDVSSGG